MIGGAGSRTSATREAKHSAVRRLAVVAGVLALVSGAFGVHAATSLVAAAATPALTFSAPVAADPTTDPNNTINHITCPSRTFCAATDYDGNLLTSTNPAGGAASWTVVKLDTVAVYGVTCPSASLCVAFDGNGNLLSSTNPAGGAAAWTQFPLTTHSLIGLTCPSVSFCAFLFTGGVATSTNPAGGARAWKQTSLADTFANGIACPTASLCVMSEGQGNVLTSTDPTAKRPTWVTASVDAGRSLQYISCASESLCAAVDSTGGFVISTSPRGGSAASWSSRVDIDGTSTLRGISCPSTAPGFCVTDDPTSLLSSTAPTTGATSWAVQSPFGSVPSFGIGCADNGFCVVSDQHGNIAVGTANAGAPAVTGIAPAQGPLAGGSSVTLTGGGFSTTPGATTVDFGATAASGVTCASTTSCTVSAPTGAPGVVNVTAAVGGVTSAAGPLNDFTYQAPGPPPTITGVAPAQGPAGGSTPVTITGSGFDTAPGATSVTFGSQPAGNVTCSSPTTCVVTDPPGLGPQIVVAHVGGQTSSGSTASTFGYQPPFVTSISPTNASTAGGSAVTISGANFDTVAGTTQVSFGSAPAGSVSCATATTCVATSPAGTGAVIVSVTEGPATTPPTSAESFTYVTPPVAAVSCGATITQSVNLTQDLGPCPGNGLVITASNITVDLAGHRIFGTADASDNRVGVELTGVTGVTVTGSATTTTVMGNVDGFASGVGIDGGSGNTITQLDVHDNAGPASTSANRGDGIVIGSLNASANNVISNDVVSHNGVFDGIGVFSAASTGNQILNSQITNNNIPFSTTLSGMLDDGVNLGFGLEGSNDTTISGNTISGSGLNGIDACSAAGNTSCLSVGNVITGNLVQANGTHGVPSNGINITAANASSATFVASDDTVSNNRVLDNLGIGIWVQSPYTIITNNVATGNATDPTVDLRGATRYDIYDATHAGTNKQCVHNTWDGNTFDANEASPACTTSP